LAVLASVLFGIGKHFVDGIFGHIFGAGGFVIPHLASLARYLDIRRFKIFPVFATGVVWRGW